MPSPSVGPSHVKVGVWEGATCSRSLRLEAHASLLRPSCHVCGFETELNVQFVSHMSLHVDKEQWMFSICCTACDFVTMEEAEIKAHISSKHTGDHPPCRPFPPFSPPLAAPPDRDVRIAVTSPSKRVLPCSPKAIAWPGLCLASRTQSQAQMQVRGSAGSSSVITLIANSRGALTTLHPGSLITTLRCPYYCGCTTQERHGGLPGVRCALQGLQAALSTLLLEPALSMLL